MTTVSAFIDCARKHFSFLEALGFRETGHREDPDHLYGEVLFGSTATDLKVWIDGRGEVDATLRRTAFADSELPIYRFDRSHNPNRGVRPAFGFGRDRGTSLETAVTLLAAFVRSEAAEALLGDPEAWEHAATWKQPPARLP